MKLLFLMTMTIAFSATAAERVTLTNIRSVKVFGDVVRFEYQLGEAQFKSVVFLKGVEGLNCVSLYTTAVTLQKLDKEVEFVLTDGIPQPPAAPGGVGGGGGPACSLEGNRGL